MPSCTHSSTLSENSIWKARLIGSGLNSTTKKRRKSSDSKKCKRIDILFQRIINLIKIYKFKIKSKKKKKIRESNQPMTPQLKSKRSLISIATKAVAILTLSSCQISHFFHLLKKVTFPKRISKLEKSKTKLRKRKLRKLPIKENSRIKRIK